MNPFEEQLKQFADNEPMFNAVRAVLYGHCDLNNIQKGTIQDVGEKSLAFMTAREILRDAFKEIGKFRTKPSAPASGQNPAV